MDQIHASSRKSQVSPPLGRQSLPEGTALFLAPFAAVYLPAVAPFMKWPRTARVFTRLSTEDKATSPRSSAAQDGLQTVTTFSSGRAAREDGISGCCLRKGTSCIALPRLYDSPTGLFLIQREPSVAMGRKFSRSASRSAGNCCDTIRSQARGRPTWAGYR